MANFFSRFMRRFDRSPITTVKQLSDYVGSRGTFVAQDGMYGYLKARMGTQYVRYFEDEKYGKSMQRAALSIACVAVADLAIYAAGKVMADRNLPSAEPAGLATTLFDLGTEITGISAAPDDDMRARYAKGRDELLVRVRQNTWSNMPERNADIFARSSAVVVQFAPVSQDFKEVDRDNVETSLRNHWINVRQQLDSRLRPEQIAQDWFERR